jgi:hypothetical protein
MSGVWLDCSYHYNVYGSPKVFLGTIHLDRIIHHCTVINIKGESYRLKDRGKNSLLTERRGEKNERKVIRGGAILSQ